MSKLTLNQNQFSQTPVLGQVVLQPNVDTQSCQINPNYAGGLPITAGVAVKLSNVAGPQIIVEPCATAADGPNFGVIMYNPRINTYSVGDMCEVACNLNVIYLKSSAAINRGARVAVTNATNTTNDPTVAADVTALDYTIGYAEGSATAANQLIRIKVQPALNIVPSTTATCTSVVSP